MPDVVLRDVTVDDIALFFEHQLDPDANRMAAFTARDPADREAFLRHWDMILQDHVLIKRTILSDGIEVGHLLCYAQMGDLEIGYLDRTALLESRNRIGGARAVSQRRHRTAASCARSEGRCGLDPSS